MARRGSSSAPARPAAKPRDQLLVEAGLVDQEFYEAQVGLTFPDVRAAAQHVVRESMPAGLSAHPLLDVGCLPPRQQENWRERRVARVLSFLASERAADRPWSALFDPRSVTTPVAGPADGYAAADRRALLAGYLHDLRTDTVLPTTGPLERKVTWGEARTRMLTAARELNASARLAGARTTADWDEQAETAWLAQVAEAALPESEQPLVSVVMPVWNRAEQVMRAVRSVQAQTLQHWELVVVDDGSTDGTLDVLHAAAAEDPRIVVVAAPHAGVCAARNAGLTRATGRYVAFLDSDNAWRERYLDTMVRVMARDGLRAAYAGAALHNGSRVRYRVYDGGLDHLKSRNHIDMNIFVLAADLATQVGLFDETLRRWVDHDYILRTASVEEPRFLPFIGCDYANEHTGERISNTQSTHWAFPVLAKAWLDWDEAERRLAGRVPGRTTVVLVTFDDVARTVAAVEAVVRTTETEDTDVLILDNGSPAAAALTLETQLLGHDRVRVDRLPRRFPHSIAAGLGIQRSVGELVMLLPHDAVVRPGWLTPLRAGLDRPDVLAAQPLVLDQNGTVASAGVVFPVDQALPAPLLAGHPPEDAAPLAGAPLSAVVGAGLLRAADLVAARGFDPLFVEDLRYVDLCLRLADQRPGHVAVVVDAVADLPGRATLVRDDAEDRGLFLARWRGRLPQAQTDVFDDLGLEVAAIAVGPQPWAAPQPLVVRRPGGAARWSIKAPVDPGPEPAQAADLQACTDLAEALRAHGLEVVVARRGAHDVAASALDDVVVAVRTDLPVGAQPGRANVLLVASTAEHLRPEETASFDAVVESTGAGQSAAALASALVTAVEALPAQPQDEGATS